MNKKIEYAKFMKDWETESFFKNLAIRHEQTKANTKKWFTANKDKFISAYHVYESDKLDECNKTFQKYNLELHLFDSKKCGVCQAGLKYINYGNKGFWGCPNYKKPPTNEHTSFSPDRGANIREWIGEIKPRINTHWVTMIRNSMGVGNAVQPKTLLQCLLNEGLEDLKLKYFPTANPTAKAIETYSKVKKNTSKEEKEIERILDLFFNKVIPQQGIKYKMKGEKEKYCFVDMVASTAYNVNIIEIKTNAGHIKEDQLNLYTDLTKNILLSHNDNRQVTSNFIVYDGDNTSRSGVKYCLFDEIMQCNTVTDIQKNFNINSNNF